MRINKYIAQSGYCSRRQADELIKQGKVLVNDRPVKEMGLQVEPSADVVRIKNGPTLRPQKKTIVLMLHKPKGYVCTKRDPHAKRTVYDLLPEQYQQLFSIGRLDKDTEGLLLFTNNGELAEKLAHPKYGKAKTYLVTAKGKLAEKDIERLEKGIRLIDFKAQPARVKELWRDEEKDRTTYELSITEGKNRQIHHMFLALKHGVKKLVRTHFGPYKLGKMKPGEWQLVSEKSAKMRA